MAGIYSDCSTREMKNSKSQPMGDKLSLKGTWSLSRDLFNLFGK